MMMVEFITYPFESSKFTNYTHIIMLILITSFIQANAHCLTFCFLAKEIKVQAMLFRRSQTTLNPRSVSQYADAILNGLSVWTVEKAIWP